MSLTLNKHFIPTKNDANEAKATLAQLSSENCDAHFIVSTQSNQRAQIPESIFELIKVILNEYSLGHPLMIIPLNAELSTFDAADFLGVSRPYLIKLLENGEINFRKVGKHRRIRFEDLSNYKEAAKHKRLQAIAQVSAADDAEFGLEE